MCDGRQPKTTCGRLHLHLVTDSAAPRTFIGWHSGLEGTLPTHGELELAGGTAPLIMVEGDAVVEPEGADREVEAQANANVVAVPAEVRAIRRSAHASNIVE